MPPFDSQRFRKVLGHYPTGVVVVTAMADGKPVGLTIGTFTSVSLDPPLVGFLPGKASNSWPDIQRAGSFCINVLATDQADLCWTFAKDSDDKFADVSWRPADTGAPIINGSLEWIDCELHQVVDAGDHWFVTGLVRDLDIVRDDATPLVFFTGKLGSVQLDIG